jgi:SET domain-containing protein
MIELRNSPIHGRGVFAMYSIHKGEVVQKAPFLFVYGEEIEGELADYIFLFSKKRSVLPLLHGALFNHNDKPNLDHIIDGKTKVMTFYAVRDIAANEECFIYYGKEYWKSRNLTKK